jgi:glycosyltransferase involved in cell wall biosynthesis
MFTAESICDRCERGAYYNALLHPCFPGKKQALAYASSLWIHRFVLTLEKRVSLFVCPSQYMYTRLERWGIPEEKLRIIRNFTSPVPDPPQLPGEYGAYVGRLSGEKGVHVLLRALAIAQDPPFKIVGDGPESERLRGVASKLNLARTEFLGHLPEPAVDEVLRKARFAVVPSLLDENAPLAALEAMARGRPLIVSAVGGLRELAGGGRGRIARPGDAADLAANLDSLMKDTDACRRAGAAALAFVEDELAPARHLRHLEEAYRHVASQ